MANILYLVHRLPYPPNKGDKVRSYNLLKHLIKRHRVFLGTFIDDPEDEVHIATLQGMCADLHVARLNPRRAKVRSLNGLLSGAPLTLRYYRDAELQQWVDSICRHQKIDAAVIFNSAMAQYVQSKQRMPLIIDFVDVDSAKWTQYAPKHRWPMSWIYEREGKLLLAYERQMASLASRSFFVTDAEAALFARLAPECSVRVEAMSNGVDTDYFSPTPERVSPYAPGEIPVVFTGAMDYWPNIDAVTWFVGEVLPGLRQRRPQVRFYIVGRNPAPKVLALVSEHVVVTGAVPDVRSYLQHAGVVVAPLRITRGIKNSVLEAMAMETPVVATAGCAMQIDADNDTGLLSATSPDEFVTAIDFQLANPSVTAAIGHAARLQVMTRYSWQAYMSSIDRYLPAPNLAQPA